MVVPAPWSLSPNIWKTIASAAIRTRGCRRASTKRPAATSPILPRSRPKRLPAPVWRELGFRSRSEIDGEIYALKALRGDFDDVEPVEPAAEDAKITQAGDAVGV